MSADSTFYCDIRRKHLSYRAVATIGRVVARVLNLGGQAGVMTNFCIRQKYLLIHIPRILENLLYENHKYFLYINLGFKIFLIFYKNYNFLTEKLIIICSSNSFLCDKINHYWIFPDQF